MLIKGVAPILASFTHESATKGCKGCTTKQSSSNFSSTKRPPFGACRAMSTEYSQEERYVILPRRMDAGRRETSEVVGASHDRGKCARRSLDKGSKAMLLFVARFWRVKIVSCCASFSSSEYRLFGAYWPLISKGRSYPVFKTDRSRFHPLINSIVSGRISEYQLRQPLKMQARRVLLREITRLPWYRMMSLAFLVC